MRIKTIILALLFVAQASATDKKADDYFMLSLEELMEVKLSVASFFEESELNVGSSVSKVTEKEWQRQGAEKTFDAISHLPGVYVNDYFHGMMAPSFRGFNSIVQHNSFLMLLDGIPLNNYSFSTGIYGTPNFALGNLESIEVIRGPGSALYGTGAMNGVVSLNSWTSKEDTVQAWAEAGSFGYRQATIRGKHTFDENISATSIFSTSGLNDEGIKDSYHDAVGNLQQANFTGEYSNITTSHKLAINKLDLAFYYSRHDSKDAVGTDEISPFFPNGNRTDGLAEMYAVKASYDGEINKDWELNTTAYHVHDELFGSLGLNAGSTPAGVTQDWDSEDRRTGIQSIAKKPFNNSGTQIVVGSSYDYMEVDHLGLGTTGTPSFIKNKTRHLAGVFGQLEQRFWTDWRAILGARLDHYSDFGGQVAPRVGLIYHPTENTALKLLYGNAFRAPSANEQVDNGVITGGGDSLKPEEVDTYEVIWMHSGDIFRYNISTYLSKMTNTIDFVSALKYGNGGKSESYGVEFDGTINIENLLFYGNFSINDSKIFSPTSQADSKAEYGSFPDQILNLGTQYQASDTLTFAINNTIHRGRRTFFSGAATSPSHKDTGPLPPLWRTDFHINWKPETKNGDYEFYVNVRDIFNRKDLLTSLTPVEAGRNTAGTRFTFGVKTTF